MVALRRSWNQVEEIQESTSKLEPSFVGRINNQTVNVGRDVILGCQVQNLVSDYKVSLEITKVRALLFFLNLFFLLLDSMGKRIHHVIEGGLRPVEEKKPGQSKGSPNSDAPKIFFKPRIIFFRFFKRLCGQ